MERFSENTGKQINFQAEKNARKQVRRSKIAIIVAIIATFGYFIYRAITSITNAPVVANGVDLLFFVIIVVSCAYALQALQKRS